MFSDCKFSLPVIVLVSMLFVGCSGTTTVLRNASPNPFLHRKDFVVQPVRYVDLHVDGMPESEYLQSRHNAEKAASWIAAWNADKDAVATLFQESLVENAKSHEIAVSNSSAPAACTIRPTISYIESGHYRIPAWNAVTRVRMTVDILDASGNVQDQIQVQSDKPFDAMVAPSVGGRLRDAAKDLGQLTAAYLEQRTRNP